MCIHPTGLVRVSNCERLTLVCAGRRLVICNCLDSIFPVYLTLPPVLAGDNRGCRLAPYNTAYPSLPHDLAAAGLWKEGKEGEGGGEGRTEQVQQQLQQNQWNVPLDLTAGHYAKGGGGGGGGVEGGIGVVREGSSGGSAGGGGGMGGGGSPCSSPGPEVGNSRGGESRILPPELFYTLSIPVSLPPSLPPCSTAHPDHPTGGGIGGIPFSPALPPALHQNPFPLPLEYASVLRERSMSLDRLQQSVLGSLSVEQRPGVETVVVR